MAAFDAAIEFLQGAQTEILLFVLAGLLHSVLFRKHRVHKPRSKAKLWPGSSSPAAALAPVPAAAAAPASQSSQGAQLLRSLRPLLRSGASREELEDKMKLQLVKFSNTTAELALVGLLDGVGRAATADLLAALRGVLRSRRLSAGGRVGERMLKLCIDLRLNSEFEVLLAEVQASPGGGSLNVSMLALKAAISRGDIEVCLARLQPLGKAWRESLAATPSAAPQQFMQQLCQLALSRSCFPELLHELHSCDLFMPWTAEALLRECARQRQLPALRSTWELAKLEAVPPTAAAQGSLIRGLDCEEEVLSCFADAAAAGGGALDRELLLAAAEAAGRLPSEALARAALADLPAAPDAEVLGAALRLAEGILAGEDANASILEIYQKHGSGVDILSDPPTSRLVVEAAIAHGRADVLRQLLSASPEVPRQISLLKSLGAELRLQDALKVFRACPDRTTCLYNAMLDTCIECKDMAAAEKLMTEASRNGQADVITYNTIIKAYLQVGSLDRARRSMEAMRAAGLAPNCVTFNELIDASIRVSNSSSVWVLIEEMEACGLKPSQVTCSILLKSIRHPGQVADLERTMKMLGDQLEEEMDEVLLSSICEACIRCNRPDLLQRQLQLQRSGRVVQVRGAHTVGSIIRGFGFIHDVEGVWATWREMRSRKIPPTSITMGCMVEAVVNNEGPEAGYEVTQEMLADEETRPLLNAVIYCSVLKGFSHQKQFSRVWDVYEEMLAQKLQFSIVTYNTLVDACARSCEMSRVPRLLSEMVSQNIDPNVITYSTILKGYCQEQKLEKAFELLDEMKRSSSFQPDEITYNTLLDGCARRGLYEEGVSLLRDMEQAGVKPSNFTLSVVVKLAKRSHDPDKAFDLCEQLARKHRLRLNVHVYNNLMHACTLHGENRRAVEVLARMLGERVRPDQRTYVVLLRAFIAAGHLEEAAGLLRAAAGLGGVHPELAKFDSAALQPRGGFSSEALSEALEGMSRPGGDDALVAELLRDLRASPAVRLDSKVLLRLCSSAAAPAGRAAAGAFGSGPR